MADFILELHVPGVITRAVFDTRRKAENARRKVAKEMAKGKFRNDADIVEIQGTTGSISARASEIVSVCVVDLVAWEEMSKRHRGVSEGDEHVGA